MMDILISTIIPIIVTVIINILVFIFKESYKHKITLLSKDVDFLKTYRAKDFDYTNQAIKNIWNELALIHDYFKYEAAQDMEKGTLSNLKLRLFLLNIEKETISLPDELHGSTKKFLDDMSKYWVIALSKIMDYYNLAKSNKLPEEKCIEEANKSLDEFRNKFQESLSELRKEHRNYITNQLDESAKRTV